MSHAFDGVEVMKYLGYQQYHAEHKQHGAATALRTREREFAAIGARPFYAFTGGVVVNVILG
jgi:hypothetical protein